LCRAEIKRKEETMEIGGCRCHLCGARCHVVYTDSCSSKYWESGFAKKHVKKSLIEYKCGTIVTLGTSRNGTVEKKKAPKVIVGKKCIHMGGSE
jgi:hypothetical protein